jgi:hypothetical protein
VAEPDDLDAAGGQRRIPAQVGLALLRIAVEGCAVQLERHPLLFREDVEVDGAVAEPDRVLTTQRGQAGAGEDVLVPQISSALRQPAARSPTRPRSSARAGSLGDRVNAAAIRSGVVIRSLTARMTGSRRPSGGRSGHASTSDRLRWVTGSPRRVTTGSGPKSRDRCTVTPARERSALAGATVT